MKKLNLYYHKTSKNYYHKGMVNCSKCSIGIIDVFRLTIDHISKTTTNYYILCKDCVNTKISLYKAHQTIVCIVTSEVMPNSILIPKINLSLTSYRSSKSVYDISGEGDIIDNTKYAGRETIYGAKLDYKDPQEIDQEKSRLLKSDKEIGLYLKELRENTLIENKTKKEVEYYGKRNEV